MKSKWLLIPILIAGASCVSAVPRFNWRPPIFATDSRSQVIVRGSVVIKTSDPKFDGFICTPKAEIGNAVRACQDIINQCETWKQ